MNFAGSKRFVTLVAVFVCAPLVVAQNTGRSKTEQELIRLEDEWYKAYLNSDAETMNRIEGEDMIVITSTINTAELRPTQKKRSFAGRSEETKATFAKRKRTLSNIQIRVLGDVAVVNAIQNDSAADGTGQRRAAYTSVWAKRGGAWQVINAQWTPIRQTS